MKEVLRYIVFSLAVFLCVIEISSMVHAVLGTKHLITVMIAISLWSLYFIITPKKGGKK